MAVHRAWLVRRRRFIAERLMALHDSPLADALLRALALRALCSAAHAPELAADLVLRAGNFSRETPLCDQII